jgi:para-nitrobenzyl esterase
MLMNQIKTPEDLRLYLLDVYHPRPEDVERLLQRYAVSANTTPDAVAKRAFAEHLLTDNRLLARSLVQRGAKTYVYLFTRVNSGGRMTRLGAFHGAEVPYVFGGVSLGGTGSMMGLPVRYDENDARLGAAMNTSWYRFASTGNPNGGDLPSWPAYDASREAYLEFGDTIRARDDLPTQTLDELWSIRRRAIVKLAAHR